MAPASLHLRCLYLFPGPSSQEPSNLSTTFARFTSPIQIISSPFQRAREWLKQTGPRRLLPETYPKTAHFLDTGEGTSGCKTSVICNEGIGILQAIVATWGTTLHAVGETSQSKHASQVAKVRFVHSHSEMSNVRLPWIFHRSLFLLERPALAGYGRRTPCTPHVQ